MDLVSLDMLSLSLLLLLQQCLGHTWYLAVEMQFFWISPLILYPLARKPKIGLVILGALFIFSVIIPGKISYDLKMSAFLFGDDLYVIDVTN